MTTWNIAQVGLRTMQPRPHTNIGIPNDNYSDYHLAEHPASIHYNRLRANQDTEKCIDDIANHW